MELWKKIRIPIDKAKQILLPGAGEETGEREVEKGGEGEAKSIVRRIPWKKVVAIAIILLGLAGATVAAAIILSNILTVGTVSLQPGSKVTASLVAGLPTSMKIYENETFKFKLTNNDGVAHTVNIWGNVSLTSGTGIDYNDFELACNGTLAESAGDYDEYVIIKVPRSDTIDPGKTVLYVCWIKFTDEGLADKQVKVQVAAEET